MNRQHQADFTASPPSRHEAPWMSPLSVRGESAWDHSKMSRAHPEWTTTAHGTTDRLEQRDDREPEQISTTHPHKGKKYHQHLQPYTAPRVGSYEEFGHTIQHGPSFRSIHRDLENI
ncbi:hypothetical protein DM01DRAFT_1312591 [Hesseltinella vesiculosa]|uniref:Uncharacterized protein n=1 Tax=Hesseltinella vesiculosa TaxID=101127 RepID=A0A1X2G430_9FUNG|nr:hypothetical protein DM01DRAFT_1312591 [Hesseltinella vesiculosa]